MADPAYSDAINNLNPKFAAAQSDFPGEFQNDKIASLTATLDQPSFSTAGALDMIKKMRFDATQAYRGLARTGDPDLATIAEAKSNAANALEGLIERNASDAVITAETPEQAAALGGALGNYRSARIQIAKAYAVKQALNDATGDVDASVLRRAYENGAPLTGGLKTIAQTAAAYPKAMQHPAAIGSVPAFSPFDVAMGSVAGVLNPKAAAVTLARPGISAAILSKAYQRGLSPDYSASTLRTTAADVLLYANLLNPRGPTQ